MYTMYLAAAYEERKEVIVIFCIPQFCDYPESVISDPGIVDAMADELSAYKEQKA